MKNLITTFFFRIFFTLLSISFVNNSNGQVTQKKGILPQSDFSKNKEIAFATKNYQDLGFKKSKDLKDGTMYFKSPINSKEKIDIICETIKLVNSKGKDVYITKLSDNIRKETIIITEEGNNIHIVENGQMKQITGSSVGKSSSVCDRYIQAAAQPCKNLVACISINKHKCSRKRGVFRKIWCYTTSCAGSGFGCIGNVVQYIACIVAND